MTKKGWVYIHMIEGIHDRIKIGHTIKLGVLTRKKTLQSQTACAGIFKCLVAKKVAYPEKIEGEIHNKLEYQRVFPRNKRGKSKEWFYIPEAYRNCPTLYARTLLMSYDGQWWSLRDPEPNFDPDSEYVAETESESESDFFSDPEFEEELAYY
jgi:hypothetical protein